MNITEIDIAIGLADGENPATIPHVEGYSSDKVRRLLHNLAAKSKRYLEIGVHRGSTFIPAVHGNYHLQATCIDNWTLNNPEYKDREAFQANIDKWLTGHNVKVIDAECFSIDPFLVAGPVDLYFYDGAHDHESQRKALTHFYPVLADEFVLVIDDWRWEEVRSGTNAAIRSLGLNVINSWELGSDNERDERRWWNILFVALARKA